ncbi:uroporphyrinogen-III C-methyltransferase [Pseudoxanthomonas broegbernensis]|uniref:uroporphyrinogen-III C-methyltransferase n=1 Tax=Pseudoxanthomonas broegbernensis TaxID=83619 RepID=A0A7V8K852_9GAMM|nr:uroporphyrinogen-III C-methyltransferase [Pseudoxanthomonas broegbernensis]KAF1687385.1 uroporphyrinogen-III C-methyltransferase [Pseudoxanthomonas broegbernensis]
MATEPHDDACAPRRIPAEVVLLSAGPGDLELLTLKAVRALAAAEVLLLDELVDPDIASLAPRARVVRVGKRGGCRSTPQAFICRLMRRYALQGLRVVRVKGGDALMFGRAGEEIAFLRAAGVPVRIVNGISAAFAAAAALGVSLTHRAHCHGITFVTAHTADHGEPDWGALARSGTTLAIYMGMARIGAIARGLLRHLPGDTPVALVQAASQPGERCMHTRLDRLAQAAGACVAGDPGVILVGAALAEAAAVAAPSREIALTA